MRNNPHRGGDNAWIVLSYIKGTNKVRDVREERVDRGGVEEVMFCLSYPLDVEFGNFKLCDIAGIRPRFLPATSQEPTHSTDGTRGGTPPQMPCFGGLRAL